MGLILTNLVLNTGGSTTRPPSSMRLIFGGEKRISISTPFFLRKSWISFISTGVNSWGFAVFSAIYIKDYNTFLDRCHVTVRRKGYESAIKGYCPRRGRLVGRVGVVYGCQYPSYFLCDGKRHKYIRGCSGYRVCNPSCTRICQNQSHPCDTVSK